MITGDYVSMAESMGEPSYKKKEPTEGQKEYFPKARGLVSSKVHDQT